MEKKLSKLSIFWPYSIWLNLGNKFEQKQSHVFILLEFQFYPIIDPKDIPT